MKGFKGAMNTPEDLMYVLKRLPSLSKTSHHWNIYFCISANPQVHDSCTLEKYETPTHFNVLWMMLLSDF